MKHANGHVRAISSNPKKIEARSRTGGGLVRVSVALTPDRFRVFQMLAREHRTSVSQEIRTAADIGLDQITGDEL